jgi:hypothetical protein
MDDAMRSPPSIRGFATWLALFALGLQMIVSFGHVHLEGIARTDQARVALAGAGHAPQSLLAQQPADDDEAYCPICASVYLTANSFVPVGPVLRAPSACSAVERGNRGARVFVAQRRSGFQSRAPPLA